MRILIDSNILYPLDPLGPAGLVPEQQQPVMDLSRVAAEAGAQLLVHPVVRADLDRDGDEARRTYRHFLLQKYAPLDSPPAITQADADVLGASPPGSNDWADDHLLVAVARNAVDWLITEDRGIHRKARLLDVADRVLTAEAATEILRAKLGKRVAPPPAVKEVPFHQLDLRSPFFDSFREDYEEFDAWFVRCQRAGRHAWAVYSDGGIAAFCAAKEESDRPFGLDGRVLKICSFKVAQQYSNARYGETLLRAVFIHALANDHEHAYVTAFSKHKLLFNLLEEFGFEPLERRTDRGEEVYTKRLRPSPVDEDALLGLDFAQKFGPCHVNWRGAKAWAVPIQPRFDNALFPDRQAQATMFLADQPYSNAIRKAYLCRSPARSLAPGDMLAFYRSDAPGSLVSLGVLERAIASDNVDSLLRHVRGRTVYPIEEIRRMCEGSREVLVLRFRQVLRDFEPIPLADLIAHGVLNAPPQSISQLPPESYLWLKTRTGT